MKVKRISNYYKSFDGTKLAIDIYLNALDQVRKPVLLVAAMACRRTTKEHYGTCVDRMVCAGYHVAFMETRGIGASYGSNEGFYSLEDGKDVATIIDLLGKEEFCDGKVAMFGGSNLGAIQMMAAVNKPKYLKAIIPADCNADIYYQNYTNGVSGVPCGHMMPPKITPWPVDEDIDGTMLKEAAEQQKKNLPFLSQYQVNMWRDSINEEIGYAPNMELPVWEKMNQIAKDLQIYLNAGWYDPGVTGAIIEQVAWNCRLLIGPWRHVEMYGGELASNYRIYPPLAESQWDWVQNHIAFFDWALKGIKNTLSERPKVMYYTRNGIQKWNYAERFPLPQQTKQSMYLTDKLSGTINSLGDGTLDKVLGENSSVNYWVTANIKTTDYGRLNRRLEEEFYEQSKKCLTFTSSIFERDQEYTGFVVVHLCVRSTFTDGNFMTILEEVEEDGTTVFMTDGCVRASCGAVSPNPYWDALEIPYHRGLECEKIWLDKEKSRTLMFQMEAMSYVVRKGNRIRFSVFCGALNNHDQPEGLVLGETMITLDLGQETPSCIILPFIDRES